MFSNLLLVPGRPRPSLTFEVRVLNRMLKGGGRAHRPRSTRSTDLNLTSPLQTKRFQFHLGKVCRWQEEWHWPLVVLGDDIV